MDTLEIVLRAAMLLARHLVHAPVGHGVDRALAVLKHLDSALESNEQTSTFALQPHETSSLRLAALLHDSEVLSEEQARRIVSAVSDDSDIQELAMYMIKLPCGDARSEKFPWLLWPLYCARLERRTESSRPVKTDQTLHFSSKNAYLDSARDLNPPVFVLGQKSCV